MKNSATIKSSDFTVVIIVVVMETISTSETLINFYKTTCHDIPEGSHLQELSHFEETEVSSYFLKTISDKCNLLKTVKEYSTLLAFKASILNLGLLKR
jgi:hypothetical protein